MVQQQSGTAARFKAGYIFRELWSNSIVPVLISQLIYWIDYAVLGELELSEGRQARVVCLIQTFCTVDGYH